MGTLSSELGPHVVQADQPRVYVDANVPAGLVVLMRLQLRWDVFFVMEHDELRRARDAAHYSLARQLGRTLITLDHDYFDDRRFPPDASGGVIVLSAPDERGLAKVLRRIDQIVFRGARPVNGEPVPLSPPLSGQKLHAHLDWPPPDR
jgi:hypothetical protein